jgi:hypothetical protein
MSRTKKVKAADTWGEPVTTYTYDIDGVPLTKTITRFDGAWTVTALLQPISVEALEANMYANIGKGS